MESVQATKLVLPEMDHTNYFCMHNQKIKCCRGTLEYASCSGSCCDHQNDKLGPNQKCRCMYIKMKGGADFIMEVDISFAMDEQFSIDGKTMVTHFCSWRYSNLFMTDPSIWQKLNKHDDLIALCKAVTDVTDHVNSNGGGCTIIGWICSGWVKDQSSEVNTFDTISTLYAKPHILYLFPMENAVATTEAIKALQLTKP